MRQRIRWKCDPSFKCNCVLCERPFGEFFYDASTSPGQLSGIWGLLCEECFQKHGCKLGYGFGQKYETSTKLLVAGAPFRYEDEMDADFPEAGWEG